MTGLSYVPGSTVALVGTGCALLLDAAPGADAVGRCWPLVRDGASVGAIIEELARDGVRAAGKLRPRPLVGRVASPS